MSTPNEQKIISAINQLDTGNGASYEQLATETGLFVADLAATLTLMALRGEVEQVSPTRWRVTGEAGKLALRFLWRGVSRGVAPTVGHKPTWANNRSKSDAIDF